MAAYTSYTYYMGPSPPIPPDHQHAHVTDKAVIIIIIIIMIIIIIYHDFLPTPRRGSHVKSDKTHTQSSRYTP